MRDWHSEQRRVVVPRPTELTCKVSRSPFAPFSVAVRPAGSAREDYRRRFHQMEPDRVWGRGAYRGQHQHWHTASDSQPGWMQHKIGTFHTHTHSVRCVAVAQFKSHTLLPKCFPNVDSTYFTVWHPTWRSGCGETSLSLNDGRPLTSRVHREPLWNTLISDAHKTFAVCVYNWFWFDCLLCLLHFPSAVVLYLFGIFSFPCL